MIDRRGGGHDLGIVAVAAGWITLLLVTDRWSDLLGQTMWGAASWAVLACLLRGEAPLVRSQVAVVVVFATVVEYTSLHVWQWQAVDPTGLIGIGNPPSGAAGGYAWFDKAAALVAPALLSRAERARARLLSTSTAAV